MYLIIDNYDSFTYNIYQYLSELTEKEIRVVRNDRITIQEIELIKPEGIIISPGPGIPEEAGISVDVIRHFAGKIPILGICLGHQAIGYAFGGKIRNAKYIVHGKTEVIETDGKGLLRNLPGKTIFTRYHSLVVDRDTLPAELEVSAVSQDGEIMGLRHRRWAIEGVQFHPESIASQGGRKILKNFLNYRREPVRVKSLLVKMMRREDLSFDDAKGFMEELTEGELNNSQIAAFLAALNVKGVTAEEIAGFASVLREKKKGISCSFPVMDTCGTGGDGFGTFNISSLAALVAAACGVKVAKHGNRGVSSPTGSADFFQALGIRIDLPPDKAAALLNETGFTFLFAPIYHSAMKHAAPVRKELGIKTAMNLVGPLSNPADADYQLIGVYSEDLTETLARASKLLGVKRVMVVHGMEGLDEISVCGPTRIVMIDENDRLTDEIFDPKSAGIPVYSIEDLKGGSAAENASIARTVLSGEPGGNTTPLEDDNRNVSYKSSARKISAVKDAVLLNAGAALFVYGAAASIAEGYVAAKEALESGRVTEKIDEIIQAGRKE